MLEDLHWADGATLLLLRQLARAGGAPVLLLGTFRDTEADVPAGLAETLADLRRLRRRPAAPGGLSDAEVAEFVRRAAGGDGPRALAQALRALTEGNAFLMCELWRALSRRARSSWPATGCGSTARRGSWAARRACARS